LAAYSVGYHNGPECESCGFNYCHHCTKEVPPCPRPRPELLELLVQAAKTKR